MKRQEAVNTINDWLRPILTAGDGVRPSDWVNIFVKLGMLKLEEDCIQTEPQQKEVEVE